MAVAGYGAELRGGGNVVFRIIECVVWGWFQGFDVEGAGWLVKSERKLSSHCEERVMISSVKWGRVIDLVEAVSVKTGQSHFG